MPDSRVQAQERRKAQARERNARENLRLREAGYRYSARTMRRIRAQARAIYKEPESFNAEVERLGKQDADNRRILLQHRKLYDEKGEYRELYLENHSMPTPPGQRWFHLNKDVLYREGLDAKAVGMILYYH